MGSRGARQRSQRGVGLTSPCRTPSRAAGAPSPCASGAWRLGGPIRRESARAACRPVVRRRRGHRRGSAICAKGSWRGRRPRQAHASTHLDIVLLLLLRLVVVVAVVLLSGRLLRLERLGLGRHRLGLVGQDLRGGGKGASVIVGSAPAARRPTVQEHPKQSTDLELLRGLGRSARRGVEREGCQGRSGLEGSSDRARGSWRSGCWSQEGRTDSGLWAPEQARARRAPCRRRTSAVSAWVSTWGRREERGRRRGSGRKGGGRRVDGLTRGRARRRK